MRTASWMGMGGLKMGMGTLMDNSGGWVWR